jgi:hypothetical protein
MLTANWGKRFMAYFVMLIGLLFKKSDKATK